MLQIQETLIGVRLLKMTTLLGPPELGQDDGLHPLPQPPSTTGDSFMDAMVTDFNSTTIQSIPMGLTENMSATYLSSGNPCLDFFFHVVPNTPAQELKERVELAWKHDPLTTLKLICNLRGVRGTGKSDKESYYSAALWLHEHHPQTFASNVESFAHFGYYKDLLEVLFRLLEGADARKIAKSKHKLKKNKGLTFRQKIIVNRQFKAKSIAKKEIKDSKKSNLSQELRIKAEMERAKELKAAARICRKENILSMAKKAIEKYKQDAEYQFLHNQVSDLFANHLKSDLQLLNSNKANHITLAAKWCPSIDSSYDKYTLMCESIGRKIFPKSDPEYEKLDEAHYAYRVRDRLRKEVLVPLRQTLELPELFMSANRWNELPYNRVSSVAMKMNKGHFVEHDKERFEEYLANVSTGKAKIAAGALLPHEILSSLSDDGEGQVAELQWKRMVEDLLKIGQMKNCIAVCDVSGSMNGIPMQVCIALGMLLSEVSEDPWKGKVITFSSEPQLQTLVGESLRSKMTFMQEMDWGQNTDFQKVFDLILQVAIKNKLTEEAMIKRIFVFSDMEFDQASSNSWETDYEVIKKKFKQSGYENAVPELVFWNLRNSRATPVPATERGVALVSGYSKNLLKLFLNNGGVLNPEDTMAEAISGLEYSKLKVVD